MAIRFMRVLFHQCGNSGKKPNDERCRLFMPLAGGPALRAIWPLIAGIAAPPLLE
jgi:hypothetical protein